MAMPEPPENYEWSVLLGKPRVDGFHAVAHVFLRPQPDTFANVTYNLPAYVDKQAGQSDIEAVEATARRILEQKEAADASLVNRMALANEWSESLGCEVKV